MIYLDPKSDIIFKKLFGTASHKNILMSFLNAVLAKTQEAPIVDVVINDPHNIPERKESKRSIVDVRCTDQAGMQYIVEMQVTAQRDFTQRAQYYTALGIHRQLNAREEYGKLLPVIFIGILDFALLKTTHYLSHHRMLNIENHVSDFMLTEYHIIELPKFNKEITEISAFIDKWIYFLQNAPTFQEVPAELDIPILHDAFNVLAYAHLTKAELEAYDGYLDDMRCASSQLRTAEERGLERGKAEGEKLKAYAIAQQLLEVLDCEIIAQKTGLSLQEVYSLKDNAKK